MIVGDVEYFQINPHRSDAPKYQTIVRGTNHPVNGYTKCILGDKQVAVMSTRHEG